MNSTVTQILLQAKQQAERQLMDAQQRINTAQEGLALAKEDWQKAAEKLSDIECALKG